MMPVFMNPLAFWGAVALVAVAAIYLFRRQSRDVKVSTLMFWSTVKIPAEGGRKITTLQTPLTLLLELMILSLFVLAAASPRAIMGEKLVPLVLVLDDSFSMLADDPKSPRAEALQLLAQKVFSRQYLRISMIKAGVQPEIIGKTDMTPAEASYFIESWHCNSPVADLNAAIRNAHEIFAADTRIVVLTDSDIDGQLSAEITWLAFGRPKANLAITAANRYALGDVDRCFVEFSNLASQPALLVAEIFNAGNRTLLERIEQTLPARSNHRVRLTLSDVSAPLTAEIKNDPISYDNHAWLMPVRKAPVKVAINVAAESLKRLLQRTVEASFIGTLVASTPELIISDNLSEPSVSDRQWLMTIDNASQPSLLKGTVTIEKNHPLCQGLPPVRATWAVRHDYSGKGFPLMSVAGVSLLEVAGDPEKSMNIGLNFAHDYSNLQLTPVWPILFWNLLSWRQKFIAGPESFNYRSGMEISIAMPPEASELVVKSPSGKKQNLSVWRRHSVFNSAETGLYELHAGPASWTVAVNLNSVEESDLSAKSSSSRDFSLAEGNSSRYFSDVRWWFIIPAFLLLMLHQWLLSRRRPGYVY